MILKCNCEHEFQDKGHGEKNRVHNHTLKGRTGPIVYRCTAYGMERPKSSMPGLPRTKSEWLEHYYMWETGRVTDHEGGWKRKENRHMDLTFDEYIGIECPEE